MSLKSIRSFFFFGYIGRESGSLSYKNRGSSEGHGERLDNTG